MMASMFSAGAALLLAAAAAPQASTDVQQPVPHLQTVRAAAVQAAHEDAQAYLRMEERRDRMIFASSESPAVRKVARFDAFLRR